MTNTNSNPFVMRVVNMTKESYLEMFQQNNKTLDEIQKALDQYLEKKRTEFSRFFFLSNDELLLILAEANRNPEAVQPHLRKCFENINRVVMGEGIHSEGIVAILSAEQERIPIIKFPRTRDPVEKWLFALEEEMIKSVKKAIKEALSARDEDEEGTKRPDWVL